MKPSGYFKPFSKLVLFTLLVFFTQILQASNATWDEVDQLIKEQKFSSASKRVDSILQQAQKNNDVKNWTRALVSGADYRIRQGQMETAVREFKKQPWPHENYSQLILNLYYADTLTRYINQYSWEINQREKLDTNNTLDLKKMTMEQLVAEANDAFLQAYKRVSNRKDPLGTFDFSNYKHYFNVGDYPQRIRGTLRDAVTYLWVDSLLNQSLWSPSHSNQSYQITTQQLLTSPQEGLDPADTSIHPLHRLAWLLDDLETAHTEQNKPEAALEAMRVRIEKISRHKNDEADKQQLIHALGTRMEKTDASLPWINMLRFSLAKLIRFSDTADSHIKALAVLNNCVANHVNERPHSLCAHQITEIKNPSFQLHATASDGLKKRSIRVEHRNIPSLYFRAWRTNIKDSLEHRSYEYAKKLLNKPPATVWQVTLPKNQDYKHHQSYITPPMQQLGYWIIAASTHPDFKQTDENKIAVTSINLTNLVATSNTHKQTLDITVYQGETGQFVPQANIEVWQNKGGQGAKHIKTIQSGSDGHAQLTLPQSHRYALIIKHGNDSTLLKNIHIGYNYNREENQKVVSSLVFTDRAIYRPEQKIQWKMIAYKGDRAKGKYQVFPHSKGHIELLDSNSKVVEKIQVKTNEFGSASGEFIAATGRMLGNWNIRTSWHGHQSIRVEEYKRPTFSAKFEDSEQPLRLNEETSVTGSAQYYFGQSVTEGKVKWSVSRKPRYSWAWYSRGYPAPHARAEIIATGDSTLDAEGHFKVNFLPKAKEDDNKDNNKDNKGKHSDLISYQFEVSAEITDAGGETRTAKRSYRLGSIAIEATLSSTQKYGTNYQAYTLDVNRTDLDGIGRAGQASWSLHTITQPNQPTLPSEIPLKLTEKQQTFATEGDTLRPRWESSNESPETQFKDWKEAQQINQGSVQHNAKGEAEINLGELRAGLYRLHYHTEDQWGKTFSATKNIVISDQAKTPIQVPLMLQAQANKVEVGDKAQLLLGSAFTKLPVTLEVYQNNKLLHRNILHGGIQTLDFPITKDHRGGLDFILTASKDYQLLRQQQHIDVPWTDKKLNVEFTTFRDKLRPRQKETWRVIVKDADGNPLEKGAAEVLASMYDRSLDMFAPHQPPTTQGFYPQFHSYLRSSNSIGMMSNNLFNWGKHLPPAPSEYKATRLSSGHNISYGHPQLMMEMDAGMAYGVAPSPRMMPHAKSKTMMQAAPVMAQATSEGAVAEVAALAGTTNNQQTQAQETAQPITIRSNFNETAFFYPHLMLENDGSVSFEFEVPESVTEWKVWVNALTKDLRSGSTSELTKTSKTLMVRPYLPRFLREGDRAEIEVVINNTGEQPLTGELEFEIYDPATDNSLANEYKLDKPIQNFTVTAGQNTSLRFSLTTPNKPGLIAIRAKAHAGEFNDGEQRALAILPSRIHLTQSRFTALAGGKSDSKTLTFSELTASNDPTRINDKLIVTVDGQLFYSVLSALPYLTDYPYECTEQTLNRFLSTSIVKSVFESHPAVASMAKKMASRDTKLEKWNDNDPNRKMLLEETPWLNEAEGSKGGKEDGYELFRILDPKVARAQQQKSLQKLRKAQTSSGGFPWWDGGRPSVYMTAYLLHGFSKALEFKVNVPKDMVQKAWKYMHKEYKNELMKNEDLRTITFINYILSAYPDPSWTAGVFTNKDRQEMLTESFKQWTALPPLLKSYLALTLNRAGRNADARLVFDSIMDSAKTDDQLGTYFAPEDRAWLWYNDNVDAHAFILRTLTELNPTDQRRHGLVQWLMLNKKLNHWKSTRATAESIYALTHYLTHEGLLGAEERARISVGNTLSNSIGNSIKKDLVFKADEYTGRKNQLVLKADEITPDMATITVSKETKNLMFASATWHFSTEKLPVSAHGDFFNITRKFYKRIQQNKEWILQPLQEGAAIVIGDQLEVQLSLRAKHSAEYIHLRSPRAAGFEPVSHTSGYKWDLNIGYYEEIRDSGANYFFERLPAGEYSFKYRLRATTAGIFRTAPATVQSMYAPEFNAYSSGEHLIIK